MENIGNDHKAKKVLIVEQIVLTSSIRNMLCTVERICML